MAICCAQKLVRRSGPVDCNSMVTCTQRADSTKADFVLEALDNNQSIAVVLLDSRNAEDERFRGAREIRSRRLHLPILFATGYADADAHIEAGNEPIIQAKWFRCGSVQRLSSSLIEHIRNELRSTGSIPREKPRFRSISCNGSIASNAKVGSSILSGRANQISGLADRSVTNRFPAA